MSDVKPPPLDAEMTVAHAERITRLRAVEAFLIAKADELEGRGLHADAAELRAMANQPPDPPVDWTGIELGPAGAK